MRDPLRVKPGAANLGGAALAEPSGKLFELGVVVSYNPNTHTSFVKTHSGRPLQDVPQIKTGPGNFDHLPSGTTVVVTWGLGWPAIIGIIDDVGLPQQAIPSMALTGVEGVGSDDPTQTSNGSNTYKPPSAPSDMGPGDWARTGTMGNHVAVLEGGLSLFGSLSAQVRSMGMTGTLQTVARRIQQVTDFGQMTIENDQGRTSLVLRAGSNQSTETGLDEQKWTIRLDLGATGDILDFRIVEPEGKTLFRLHAGSDGRVQIYGDGGVDISSGSHGVQQMRSDVAGSKVTLIAGDEAHAVQGAATTTIDGAASLSIGSDAMRAVGGASTEFVARDRVSGVGGAETQVVGAARTVRIGGDDITDVGGDVQTHAGNSVKINADGAVDIVALQRARMNGSSIVLGSNGTYRAPAFDPFLSDLSSFLGDLLSALGSLTPSSPTTLASAVAKITVFAAKVGLKLPYMSKKVRHD